jgi:hypothetical protein
MMCIECSQPVDPRTGYCTACGVWSLDLAASGAMPRYNAAQGSAHAARPTAPPPIPEWGPAEPVEAEWDLPPATVPERPAYEPPPTGFESAPPPMAPRAFVEPPVVPPVAPPVYAPMQETMPVQPAVQPVVPQQAPPAFVASDFPTPTTPTIDDLFSQAPHTPAPAAPMSEMPFAFLPPPRAEDRSEVAQPTTEDIFLDQDFDADPELTMIASRRGKTKFWTLDLPDGSVEVIVGSVIVGRAASPLQGRPGARLLSVDDPTRSVSKNHALFTDENGVLLVEDLGSMNGIVVTRADGHETELSPGIRLRLDHGSTVELGDLQLRVHKN